MLFSCRASFSSFTLMYALHGQRRGDGQHTVQQSEEEKQEATQRHPTKGAADLETSSALLRHGKIQHFNRTLQALPCKVQVLLARGVGGGGRHSCKPEEVLLITVALLVSSTLRKGAPTMGTKEAPQKRLIGDKRGGENMGEGRKCRSSSCWGKERGFGIRKAEFEVEGEKNESRIPTVSNKGFSGVAPDTGQDRNGHQISLLGAERVCQLGPRSLFSSFSSLPGLPFHPFPQENQYARDGSTWQKQGCPGSAQAHLSSRHIPRYCTRKSMSKRYLGIYSKKF